jgi:hypothetical protein
MTSPIHFSRYHRVAVNVPRRGVSGHTLPLPVEQPEAFPVEQVILPARIHPRDALVVGWPAAMQACIEHRIRKVLTLNPPAAAEGGSVPIVKREQAW